MRDVLAIAALAGLAAAGTVNVPVQHRLNPEFYEAMKITRRQQSDDKSADDTLNILALNNLTGGGYYADFGIGTPPQVLTFHLDTGSSDTWVNLKDNDFCTSPGSILSPAVGCYKQFDPEASSTYETVDRRGFKIGYLDGSTAGGDYFNDTVKIDDNVFIKQQQLGLAIESVSATGIMGLGMSAGVASREEYPTIIDNLVSQGLIDTPAFSLYLNSIASERGSFLFGGIDTKKYVDNLVTLPLESDTINGGDNVTSYAVSLKGFSADNVDTPKLQTKAIFDTGATLVLLPGRVADRVFKQYDVLTMSVIPTPFIDCDAYKLKKNRGAKFRFAFEGKTIAVPLKEMIIDAFADNQEIFQDRSIKSFFKDFNKVCMFGIASADNYKTQAPDPYGRSGSDEPEYALLGDTFLRSAYIVYDLAGQQISLAQAYPNSTETNIVQLKANTSLPMIKGMDAPPEPDYGNAAFARAPSAALAGAFALVAALAAF